MGSLCWTRTFICFGLFGLPSFDNTGVPLKTNNLYVGLYPLSLLLTNNGNFGQFVWSRSTVLKNDWRLYHDSEQNPTESPCF